VELIAPAARNIHASWLARRAPARDINDDADFIPWRRDYYSKFKKLPKNAKLHPTDKTLQWDMMLGRAIVKWAHEQGLRGKQSLPTVTFTPKKKRVRPAFEIPECRRLWRTMYKRINDARDERIRRSRELLRDYVLILANSGMRKPGQFPLPTRPDGP
jgi:integrase